MIVDGKAAPDLSDGLPVLIPYADNLNVAGVNAELVQEVKDGLLGSESMRNLRPAV